MTQNWAYSLKASFSKRSILINYFSNLYSQGNCAISSFAWNNLFFYLFLFLLFYSPRIVHVENWKQTKSWHAAFSKKHYLIKMHETILPGKLNLSEMLLIQLLVLSLFSRSWCTKSVHKTAFAINFRGFI